MNKPTAEVSIDFIVGKLSISLCTDGTIKIYSYHDYLIQHPDKLIKEFGYIHTQYNYEYKKFNLNKYASAFGFLHCIEFTPASIGKVVKIDKPKHYWNQLKAKKDLYDFGASLEYKVILNDYSLGFDFIPSALFRDELMVVSCFYGNKSKSIEWICNNSDHSYLTTFANWVKQTKEVVNV